MHTEKQKVFDEYAESRGFTCWDELDMDYKVGLMDKDEFMIFLFEACDFVQKEQQKRIAEQSFVVGIYEVVGINKVTSENSLIK